MRIGDYGQEHFDERTRNSIESAIGYIVWLLDQRHEFNNGKTALYWHLVSVCAQHTSIRSDDGDRDE